MGRRRLRRRLERPLRDLERIDRRLDGVEFLVRAPLLRERLGRALAAVPDLERLLARVSAGLAAPPELAALGCGLTAAAELADLLAAERAAGAGDGPAAGAGPAAAAERFGAGLARCDEAEAAIRDGLEAAPAAGFEEGGVLRAGVDRDLDALGERLRAGLAAIADLERRERARSGIAGLKVGYHRTFGYYLEVSARDRDRAPPDYERRQTLAHGERFVTAELRRLEGEALAARAALAQRARALFEDLRRRVAGSAAAIRTLAAGVARLDVARALALTAAERGYCRPRLDRSDGLTIREGRHPVVEAALPPGGFVPNDLHLRGEGEQVLVLTGPNMAGKSTYLRQAALIVLLAQCGSFVPAAEARIGLVDRIFTRVGAQDDLAAGQSTFLVEMLETAAILAAATPRSLVVLDEIGRGTSTYDGLAIARAVLEHLSGAAERFAGRGPRTLFATHYHELTALAGERERVANATVLVQDEGGRIRFLHRIVPGAADRSYGIHVAELAGLPPALIARARALLAALEGTPRAGAPAPPAPEPPGACASELVEELVALDVDALTPLEAIGALYALRERARLEGARREDRPAALAPAPPAARA